MIWLYMLFTWFAFVFFVTGLCVNLLQLLVLPLFWIHRNLYHILINKLCYCIYSHLTFMAEWWGTFDLKVYGIKEDIMKMRNEKAIIVLNHFGDVDWLGSYVYCDRNDFLPQTKVFMKDVVKYVPVIGWCWWFAEYGFLKRNWATDESCIMKIIDGRKQSQVPYVIALFSEGTRRTAEKLKASQEYAIKNNIEPLKHHLVPRTKGFAVVANRLKDDVSCIYDVEFAFPEPDKATIPNLINRGTIDAHLYIRRIPISDVSCNTEKDAAQYLKDLFKVKDECMEYFEQHGKFPAPMVDVPRKPSSLYCFMLANLFVGGIVYGVLNLFVHVYGFGSVLVFMSAMGVLLFLLVSICVHLTQTKRGSNFGLNSQKNK